VFRDGLDVTSLLSGERQADVELERTSLGHPGAPSRRCRSPPVSAVCDG
jgi:hypothetical protein